MTRGLTLIEVLAVLVVLGLASGLSLGLSGSRDAQVRQSAIAVVAEAMDHARLVAARDGGAWVLFGGNVGVSTESRQPATHPGTMPRAASNTWSRPLPSGWKTELNRSGGGQRLFVDELGCSADARIVLEGPHQRIVLVLEGLSGRLRRSRATEPPQ